MIKKSKIINDFKDLAEIVAQMDKLDTKNIKSISKNIDFFINKIHNIL